MSEKDSQKTAKYVEYLSMASALFLIFVLAPIMYLSLGETLIAGMIVVVAVVESFAIRFFIVPEFEEDQQD